MDEKKDVKMLAENGEALKETAMRAGAVIKTAEDEGEYFQGAVDGILGRFEAIRARFAGPKATA